MDNKRSYEKESYKSKPTGIRFNLEHEKVALMRSKKKTRQQLVDFLLEIYVKGENPITERMQADGKPLFNTPMIEPPKTIETKKTPLEWVAEKREITDSVQYEAFVDRLNKCNYLNAEQKKQIKYA